METPGSLNLARILLTLLTLLACKFPYALSETKPDYRLFQKREAWSPSLAHFTRGESQVSTSFQKASLENQIVVEALPPLEEVVVFSYLGKLTIDVSAAVVHTEIRLQPLIDNAEILNAHFIRFTDLIHEHQQRYGVDGSRVKRMELTMITRRMSRAIQSHSDLIDEVETLGQAQGIETNRPKRSPLHVAMALTTALSGIVSSAVTSQVLQQQAELVDHLIEEDDQLSRAVEPRIPYDNSTLSYMNSTMETLQLFCGKKNSEIRLDDQFYYGNTFEYFHGLVIYAQLMESHLNEYIEKTNRHLRAILKTFQGHIDPMIFPPSQMKQALQDLDRAKASTLKMLFDTNNRDLSAFFRMKSTLVKTQSPNTFRIGILLPLLNVMEQYELFEASTSAMSPEGHDFEILFDIPDKYYITEKGRSYHKTLSSADLMTCTKVDRNFICPHIMVLDKEPSCLHVLFKAQVETIHKHCNFAVREKREATVTQAGSQYLITAQRPLTLYARCGQHIPDTETSSVGQNLVTVPPSCSLDTQSHLIAASSNNSHVLATPKNLLVRLGSKTVLALLTTKYPLLSMDTPEGMQWIQERVQLSGQEIPLGLVAASRGKLTSSTYIESPYTWYQVLEVLLWMGAILLILWLAYLLWWRTICDQFSRVRAFFRRMNPFSGPVNLDTLSYSESGSSGSPDPHQDSRRTVASITSSSDSDVVMRTLSSGPLESTRLDNTPESNVTQASNSSSSITVITDPEEPPCRLKRSAPVAAGRSLSDLLAKELAIPEKLNKTA